MDWTDALREHVDLAAARALGEHDANPYSPTAGCFDRRYWAWKLVDFPEATFQRLVYPLAVVHADPRSRFHQSAEVLAAIKAGLAYAGRIQHPNGSFDQAFPFEQSYGATAFLVFPLIEASRLVEGHLGADERAGAERTIRLGAEFLRGHAERHGVISNHLAGAALSLVAAADRLGEPAYEAAGQQIVDYLLEKQSGEGWFPEYGGADPGYQTLCVDYLSAVAERRPSPRLAQGLERAVAFLQWFAHPDGSFGGVYGSRRTSLVYLGGLARLAAASPAAAAMGEHLGAAMSRGDIAGPSTMDAGNLAPMLTSAAVALSALRAGMGDPSSLPCHQAGARGDFPTAGLYARGTARHYAVCSTANGGTLAVFDRATRRLLLDDGGYVGETAEGVRLTSQAGGATARVDGDTIEIDVALARMPATVPTPGRFVALRLLNLTVMRSIAAGNWVKRRLVAMLMEAGAASPVWLKRRITIDEGGIEVRDRLENPNGLQFLWMRGGVPFSAIHMASAGYFHGARLGTAAPAREVDVARLTRERAVELTTRL